MALTDKLTSVADAIRAKTGDTALLTLDQMPTAIEGISSGGGEDGKKVATGTITISEGSKFSNTTIASVGGLSFTPTCVFIVPVTGCSLTTGYVLCASYVSNGVSQSVVANGASSSKTRVNTGGIYGKIELTADGFIWKTSSSSVYCASTYTYVATE